MFKKTALVAIIFFIALGTVALERSQTKIKLQVTVIDNLGNYVEGAKITIYSSADDYKSKANKLIIGETDKKGRFQYKGLEAKSYFLDVGKDQLRNDSDNAQTGSLSDEKINKVIVVIK